MRIDGLWCQEEKLAVELKLWQILPRTWLTLAFISRGLAQLCAQKRLGEIPPLKREEIRGKHCINKSSTAQSMNWCHPGLATFAQGIHVLELELGSSSLSDGCWCPFTKKWLFLLLSWHYLCTPIWKNMANRLIKPPVNKPIGKVYQIKAQSHKVFMQGYD